MAPAISDPETDPVSEHEMDPVSERETPSISEPETHPVWEGLFMQIAASRGPRRTPSRSTRWTLSRTEMPVLGRSVSECEMHPSRRARCGAFLVDGSDGADHGDDDDNDEHGFGSTGDGDVGHDVVAE